MKKHLKALISVISLLAGLAAPARLVAQSHPKHLVHYKVIDTGSFGGPNSHINEGGRLLNNSGIFTGYADTSEADPYAPDECWDGDCLVAHTFRWSNGKLTELDVIGTGPNSESNWISENGLIAGDSQNGQLDPLVDFWQIRGVLWRGTEAIEVGTLDGGYNSMAKGVNSDGVVVGLSTTLVPDPNALIMSFGLPYAFQTRAYRWEDGVLEDLGTLGGPDAIAMGINEKGQIFGNSYTSLDPSPVCGNLNPEVSFDSLTTGAFLWQNGEMINLGSFGGTCTNATAINNRGQVVGFSFLAGDTIIHPFSWDRGKLVDLGTLGGPQAMALHVNDAGDIVGWNLSDENIMHATLWSHGQITDLGAFEPDQCSFPLGINSRTQVVGYVVSNCDFGDPFSHRAFLWEPGQPMVDLNTLISPSLGIQLLNAASINDRGEMAGIAFFPDGSHRPVLLIPCDARDGDGEDCQGSVNLSAFSPRNFSTQNSISSTQRSSSITQAHRWIDRNGPLPARFRTSLPRRYHEEGK